MAKKTINFQKDVMEPISQLKEDLVKSQIFTDLDLTSYTQGYITSSNVVSENSDLGRVDGIFLRKGSTITVNAKGYSTQVAMIYECKNDGTYSCLVPSDSNIRKEYSYTATSNIIVGVSFYVNADRTASVNLAIVDSLDSAVAKTTYINVGTGKQFTDIRTAVSSITNSSGYNRYVINVYEGNYRTDDPNEYDSSYKGLIIPDYVDIVGIGNRDNIVLYWRGTSDTSTYNNNISTLNVGGHNTIENVTIVAKHTRYCIHDDFLATGETEQSYKNVKFVVEVADSGMDPASSNICYGAGAEIKKKLYFENCIFKNENNCGCFFYHDITASKMITGADITFKNCRFLQGRYAIQFTKANTPKVSNVYMHGCKANMDCFIRGDGTSFNSIYVSGYANSNIKFTGNGTIAQDEIDRCIDLI